MNKLLSYREAFEAIESSTKKMLILRRNDTRYQFAYFSANLQCFLPRIPVRKHIAIYKRMLMRQQWSHLDQNHPQAMHLQSISGIKPIMKQLAGTGAAIICTYHTGSYRLLNKFLMKAQVPYLLLVAEEVIADEEALYKKIYRETCPDGPANYFELVSAQDPAALFKLARGLRVGKKVLIYVDGNTGSREDLKHLKACEISFLGKQLKVRKGIATLAYLTRCPIFPIISERIAKKRLVYKLLEPINIVEGVSRQDFERQTMQLLYNYLEAVVNRRPEEWEGWLTIHEYAANLRNYAIFLPKQLLKPSRIPDKM